MGDMLSSPLEVENAVALSTRYRASKYDSSFKGQLFYQNKKKLNSKQLFQIL